MDTVRSEYSDTGSALGTGRFGSTGGGGSSGASFSFVDSSSYGSSRGSTTRSDFLSNYEQKFLTRKAEKKKKREREKRLVDATSNQLTADDKRRADREAERLARKAEMATWLPTKEALERVALDRKKRSRQQLRDVLQWYPPLEEGTEKAEVPTKTSGLQDVQRKLLAEMQPLFSPDSPHARDARRLEQQRTLETQIQTQTSALQRRVADLQQKMDCVEHLQAERRSPEHRSGVGEAAKMIARRRVAGGRGHVPGKVSRLAPLAGANAMGTTQSLTALPPSYSQQQPPIAYSRSASSSYFFRDTPAQLAHALVTEAAELDAFLLTHKRERRRDAAARKIQATWRMVRQRRRYRKWRRWRTEARRTFFQVWALSHRIKKHAEFAAKRKYLRAWRGQVKGAIELLRIELKLFREAETQAELPKIVMNLAFTASEDDDAYTRKVLANPLKHSYFTGFVNAAFASVERLSTLEGSKNRVRLLKAQHVEARRVIAKKIVQRCFLLWKKVHGDEKRIGLNAQLCIKRAARMAFQNRPVWATEKQLNIFELWARWAAFSRAKRLGVPMPHFTQPLSLWDTWLHNYHERQIRKVKAAAKAPLARMKRCFRQFRVFAAYALRKRLAHEKAVRHFQLTWSRAVMLEWRAAIADSAYEKKLLRTVLHSWRGYAKCKARLRPAKRQVLDSRLLREQQRAWGAWRNVQLRSCFKRELHRARLQSQPKWRWKVQRLLLVWMDIRSQLRKWQIFVAWKHAVQRRKLFLTLRAHCDVLRRKHLLYGVFGAWKAVVWKQEDEFLEDRLQLSAWDTYKELSPLLPDLFYGCYSDAAAIFGGVPSAAPDASSGAIAMISARPPPTPGKDDTLARRQREICAYHVALLQGSVVEARNLILKNKHLINGVDELSGNTALHVAVSQIEEPVRRFEIVTLLLSEGAYTWDKPNRHGLTPKQLAPDDDTRVLMERGVYAFHTEGVLKRAREEAASGESRRDTGLAEARLVWCLVALMSSEYVRGERLAGDYRREWHSVLKDELWLRRGRVCFASTSSFSPAIQRCRAFLNGMKRRVCRSKDDVVLEAWTQAQKGPEPTVGSSRALLQSWKASVSGNGVAGRGGQGSSGRGRPMLIKSGTRRMLSRDLARMEEKIDLLSWLKNTPDDPTSDAAVQREAEEKEDEAELVRVQEKMRALGDYGAYAEMLLTPVLNDELAEQELVLTFVGVLFALTFPLDTVLTTAMRFEDECTRLEAEVLQNNQAIMRAELRCRSPELPTGLPLLRYFTEQPDAEFFFKRELLLVNLALFRWRQRHGLSGEATQEEDENDEYPSSSPSMNTAGELLLEVEMLLAKAQRKERKVAKKLVAVQQQVASLHEAYALVMLKQQQPPPHEPDTTPASVYNQRMAEICGARMRLESERLRLANLRLKQLDWAAKASELVTTKGALKAEHARSGHEGSSALLELESDSTMDRDELEHKRRFLEMQLQVYLQAIKAQGVAKTNSTGALLTLPMTELRRLHKATTKALWTLFITNLFRSGCCWLAETLMTQEEESRARFEEGEDEEQDVPMDGLKFDQSGQQAAALRKKTVVISAKDGSGVAVVGEITEHVSSAVVSTFAAARKASAAVCGPTGGSVAHRRSSLTNARGVLDTLQRSSTSTEMAEIHTAMMRENYSSSSQLLFESDRNALVAEEERARRLEADLQQQKGHLRSKLDAVAELNPLTGLAETPSSRLMSEVETAVMMASRFETATHASQSIDASTRQKNRKREQLRQAMMQRQVERLVGEATTGVSEKEKDTVVNDPSEKNRQTLAAEAHLQGAVDVGFGNFVVGSRALTTPQQQVQAVATQKQQFTRVSSTPSTSTDKMLAGIAAESLWKRGGAVRRQGDGGSGAVAPSSSVPPGSAGSSKGSSFELFASAEDEMAFNMSFRVMSAAKERRSTPNNGSHRLSMIGIVAGSGIERETTADQESAASTGGESPLNGQTEVDLQALAERFEAAQEFAWRQEASALDGVLASSIPVVEPDFVRASTALGASLPATLPDLSSIVSVTEESEFFDHTLQNYLDRVRRDSTLSSKSVVGLLTLEPQTVTVNINTTGAFNGSTTEPRTVDDTAPEATPCAESTPLVVLDEPADESVNRLRAPYIKWESGSASPLSVASAATEDRVHHPLQVESTPLRPQVTMLARKSVIEPESLSSQADDALRGALSEIERKVNEEAAWQQQRKEPRKLSLSGKSFAMRVRQRKTSDAGTSAKSQSRARSNTISGVPSFDSPEPTALQSEVLEEIDFPMSPSVPKVMVTIQRKSNPDSELEVGSALPIEEQEPSSTVVSASPMWQPSLLTLCELGIKSSKAKDARNEVKPKPAKDPSRRRLSQPGTVIAKPRKLSQAPDVPVEFLLEGAGALAASVSTPSLSSANDRGVAVEDAGLPPSAYIPQLTEEQKRGVWRDFTATALTDAMQDAYAQLYPHLYEPATPLMEAQPAVADPQRRASLNPPTEVPPPPVSMPIEKQIELDKRFWGAVEGYKSVGVAGLIPLDEKTAKARRQDCAVAIYQQFLRPGLATRLVWLDMYADELRVVEQRLLQAPVVLFDALQQTAQLHISTVLAKRR